MECFAPNQLYIVATKLMTNRNQAKQPIDLNQANSVIVYESMNRSIDHLLINDRPYACIQVASKEI